MDRSHPRRGGGRGPRTTALARAAALALAAGVPVAALAWLVRAEHDGLTGWDARVVDAATTVARERPGLPRALVVWQETTQPVWLVLGVTVVALVVWRRHRLPGRAAWAVATVLVVWGLGVALKSAVGRARPVVQEALEHAPGYSFPSGHAVNSSAALTVLLLLLRPVLTRRALGAVAVVGGLVVALTAADRVLLGVHYPSDVAAGLLVGTAASLASYAGWSGAARHEAGRTGAAGTGAAGTGAAGTGAAGTGAR